MAKFWTTGNTIAEDKIRLTGQLPAVFGGSWIARMLQASFEDIDAGIHVTLDGTNAEGSALVVTGMAQVDGGTGQVRLYNQTAAAAVGSAVNITGTTPTAFSIVDLSLASGSAEYRIQATKGTTWIKVWGVSMRISGA